MTLTTPVETSSSVSPNPDCPLMLDVLIRIDEKNYAFRYTAKAMPDCRLFEIIAKKARNSRIS